MEGSLQLWQKQVITYIKSDTILVHVLCMSVRAKGTCNHISICY